MRALSSFAALRLLLADYRRTWHVTGPAGRLFLAGGLLYVIRAIGFTVAFPLFAKARGFSPGEIGLLVAASAFSLFVFGVPVTWLGGRGHSRRILTLGPLVAAAGLVVIVLAPDGATFLPRLGALLAGTGGASFWVLGDPLLAETTPATERAHVFALKFFALTIGTSLGGGLGGWIPGLLNATPWFEKEAALTATLLVFAAIDLACAAVFSRIPPYEPKHVRRRSAPTVGSDRRRAFNWIPWAVMIALAVPELGMALGHNSIRPFLSLFFTEQYAMSEATTGTTLAALALIGGFGALVTPRIAHGLGNVGAITLLRCVGAAAVDPLVLRTRATASVAPDARLLRDHGRHRSDLHHRSDGPPAGRPAHLVQRYLRDGLEPLLVVCLLPQRCPPGSQRRRLRGRLLRRRRGLRLFRPLDGDGLRSPADPHGPLSHLPSRRKRARRGPDTRS